MDFGKMEFECKIFVRVNCKQNFILSSAGEFKKVSNSYNVLRCNELMTSLAPHL